MREGADWPTRDLIAHRADATPDRTAVLEVATGDTWTYRAFDATVDRIARTLDGSAALGEDCTVGLLLSTRVETAAAFHAVLRLGGTAVLLGPDQPGSELTDRAADADVDTLVCEEASEDDGCRVADALEGPSVFSVDAPQRSGVTPLPTAGTDGNPAVEPAPLDRSHVAVVAFTSGTTGEPKAVGLTLGNLLASATASAFRLGVSPGDRWHCCLPMHHLGGLSPVVRCALAGTTVAIQSGFDASGTAAAMARVGATGVSLVPTQLRRLLEADWQPHDALRFVLLGGAPAPPDLVEAALDRDVPVCPTYGTTETASQIATARPDEAARHPGTVGQPLVTTGVTVVDDDGEPLPPGEPGELVVDGPTVSPGYRQSDPDDAFGPAGFHTGDVGYRDEDGRLWVVGRLDDRIVTGGENVQPATVVGALQAHPDVADAAVVGLADPEWGERVAALVVADGPGPDELRAFCRDRLPDYAVPKTIDVARALPRTPSGTVDRQAVRDRLAT
jgi:O-succinylbenzoic acid--CoA ligase